MQEFLQQKQLKHVYNMLINPYTEYGILAWGRVPKTHLNKMSGSI